MLTADQIREELIRQLDSGRAKAAEVARLLRIAPPRVTEMRKRERKVQQEEMVALAGYLQMDVSLTHVNAVRGVAPVPIRGKVAVGVWVETNGGADPGTFVDFDVVSENEDVSDLFAMVSDGAAMNAVFPEGTTFVCRQIADHARLPTGAFVIVKRTRDDLCEYSCKQLESLADGRTLLHNRSTDPRYAEPIALGEGVELLGRVIRAYQNLEAM
jgi:hypothetical protein